MNNGRDPKIEGLIAGWAAGTLTSDEQAALMQAALQDQALFDELADAEPLREAFADPATRTRLLDALEPPLPWYRKRWTWAAAAVPVLAGIAWLVMIPRISPPASQTVLIAKAPRPPSASQPPEVREAAPPAAGRLPKETIYSARNDEAKETGARAKTAVPPRPAAEVLADEPRPIQAQKSEVSAAAAQPAPDLAEAKRQEEKAGVVAAAPPPLPALSPPARTVGLASRMALQAGTTLTLLARDTAEGLWKPLPDQSVAPAGKPLRLRVITASAGLVRIQPGDHRLVVRQAGQAVEIDLGSYQPGEQTLEATVTPMPAGPVGENAAEMRANQFRAADSAKQEAAALRQARQAPEPRPTSAPSPTVTKLNFRVR